MGQERKNKTKAIMVIALAVCLVSIAVTAAYFIVNIRANNQELTVTTGTMALTFSDNSDGINQSLMFGESVTKDFKIENTGTLPAVAKISFEDLVNTYLAESLTYTLSYATSETGTYTTVKSANVPRSETSSKVELTGNLTIPAGQTYYYRLTIKLEYLDDIDQTEDLNASFSTRFTLDEDRIGEDTYTVNVSGLTLEVNRKRPDFGTVATTDEGVYAMTDNYGTSYYFRGAVENNYVKFGKWADGTDYAGSDMYWRIIRVNGDGSVRMIYDGTSTRANGENSSSRRAFRATWNSNNNDVKYAGYMYGGADGEASTSKEQAQTNETSSNIKTVLESWYETNLAENYSGYIADVIFCNDRSTADTPNTWYVGDTTLGYGTNATTYGAFNKLYDMATRTWSISPTPTFVCPTNSTVSSNNDWFTAEATESNKGNGALDYPVGLITVDEIVAAGGRWRSSNENANNYDYYLYDEVAYWTLSPQGLQSGAAFVITIGNGSLNSAGVENSYLWVAPVINLSAETAATLVGDGTIGNEYKLSGN